MADNKSLPKTQYEISQGRVKSDYNKANNVSRRDDTLRELNIGLHDLDYAIQYYFEQVIKPQVEEGDRVIQVPTYYASPERWKNFQKDGYFRDINGKIQTPLIAYRRTAVTKNRTLSSKVDGNFPAVYYTQQKSYTPENRYDQFSKLTNARPINTFINTVMCDYVDLTYEFMIWTDYVEQMNKVVESVLYSEGSYWGEKERFKFRVKIDDFQNTTDLPADEERVVRTTFTVTLYGYIVPDAVIKQLSDKLSNKTFSTRQTILETNVDTALMTVGNPQTVSTPTIVFGGGGASGGGGGISSATLTYLGTNKAVTATSITVPNTVTFTAAFLTAPIGLPTTSKDNFSFFVNGQYVEPAAVTSFVDNGSTCILVLDLSQLGFTLITTDEVVAVGKFI